MFVYINKISINFAMIISFCCCLSLYCFGNNAVVEWSQGNSAISNLLSNTNVKIAGYDNASLNQVCYNIKDLMETASTNLASVNVHYKVAPNPSSEVPAQFSFVVRNISFLDLIQKVADEGNLKYILLSNEVCFVSSSSGDIVKSPKRTLPLGHTSPAVFNGDPLSLFNVKLGVRYAHFDSTNNVYVLNQKSPLVLRHFLEPRFPIGKKYNQYVGDDLAKVSVEIPEVYYTDEDGNDPFEVAIENLQSDILGLEKKWTFVFANTKKLGESLSGLSYLIDESLYPRLLPSGIFKIRVDCKLKVVAGQKESDIVLSSFCKLRVVDDQLLKNDVVDLWLNCHTYYSRTSNAENKHLKDTYIANLQLLLNETNPGDSSTLANIAMLAIKYGDDDLAYKTAVSALQSSPKGDPRTYIHLRKQFSDLCKRTQKKNPFGRNGVRP